MQDSNAESSCYMPPSCCNSIGRDLSMKSAQRSEQVEAVSEHKSLKEMKFSLACA